MIVKGYNGIMDLDLTNVPVKLHKELIKQHHKDIKDYKLEQAKLPEKSRYENTVLIAQQKLEKSRLADANRYRELERLQYEKQDRFCKPALSSVGCVKNEKDDS